MRDVELAGEAEILTPDAESMDIWDTEGVLGPGAVTFSCLSKKLNIPGKSFLDSNSRVDKIIKENQRLSPRNTPVLERERGYSVRDGVISVDEYVVVVA